MTDGPTVQGHVSERDHMRLREKVYRVVDLVTADATRPSDVLLSEHGQAYLCIRQAFAAAFDELLEQVSNLPVHTCVTLHCTPDPLQDMGSQRGRIQAAGCECMLCRSTADHGTGAGNGR